MEFLNGRLSTDYRVEVELCIFGGWGELERQCPAVSVLDKRFHWHSHTQPEQVPTFIWLGVNNGKILGS